MGTLLVLLLPPTIFFRTINFCAVHNELRSLNYDINPRQSAHKTRDAECVRVAHKFTLLRERSSMSTNAFLTSDSDLQVYIYIYRW